MTATRLPLRFQVGARTLFAVERRLIRVALGLGEPLPALPALDRGVDGYAITSLPEVQLAELSGEGFITFVRQRYTRHFIDLTTGFDA